MERGYVSQSGKGADQKEAWQTKYGSHKVESMAYIQEEPLQQQFLVYQTDSSREMEVGKVRTLRTITLRSL